MVWEGSFKPEEIFDVICSKPELIEGLARVDSLSKRWKAWVEEFPKGQARPRVLLERVFYLLGKRGFRNLICALERADLPTQLKVPEGPVRASTTEFLPTALQLEQFCTDKKLQETDRLFIVGLWVDYFMGRLKDLPAAEGIDAKAITQALTTEIAEATRLVQIYLEKSKLEFQSIVGGEHPLYAFLVWGIAKAIMHGVYSKAKGDGSYVSYLKERTNFKPENFFSQERRRENALFPKNIEDYCLQVALLFVDSFPQSLWMFLYRREPTQMLPKQHAKLKGLRLFLLSHFKLENREPLPKYLGSVELVGAKKV